MRFAFKADVFLQADDIDHAVFQVGRYLQAVNDEEERNRVTLESGEFYCYPVDDSGNFSERHVK